MSEIEKIIKELGCELYDTESVSENGRAIYRVYITKSGGVSLDECQKVSQMLSPIYDVMPPISGDKWFLEVSSPGLERKLTKIEHFKLSLGEKVKITLNDKSVITGDIKAVDNEIINILADKGEQKISFNDIKKARTFIAWQKF